MTGRLDYPSLAGNVISVDGDAPWPDYTILTTDSGVRVGFITGTCGIHADLEFQDPIARLKEQVSQVRPQADIVIGLLHMGYEDSSGNTSRLVAQEVGKTTVELTAARELVRNRETNLGNMAADAVRAANDTDIALAIAGGIGGEIPPGPITKKDILSIGRVNSNFAVYEMTGARSVLINKTVRWLKFMTRIMYR